MIAEHGGMIDDATGLAEYRLWLGRAADVCERAARGDLEGRILQCTAEGDLGRIVHGINHLLDLMDAFVREAGASLDYASRGKFFRRVLEEGMLGTFGQASQIINRATEEMASQAAELAAAESMRFQLAEQLAAAATEMRATAGVLASTAGATSRAAMDASAASQHTSSSVEALTTVAGQLMVLGENVERQTLRSATITKTAETEAGQINQVMADLSDASRRIGGVVELISRIARQTNLLALNANIEAARSGDAGKGFAVVASEVKNLARQTAKATDGVALDIEAIQGTSAQAATALARISETIAALGEVANSIAGSMSEQREASQAIGARVQLVTRESLDVSRSIQVVTDAAQETSESAAQLLAAADELSRQAESLRATSTGGPGS